MTQRPPMIGSFPRGVIEIKEHYPPIKVEGVSEHVYGEIGYQRELGADEVYQYELTVKKEAEEKAEFPNDMANEYIGVRYE